MLKELRSIIYIFCVFVFISANAKTSHSLSRIDRLSAAITIPPLNSDTCLTISYKGYPVVIERKDENISHIGIAIFSDSLKNSFNKQLFRFVEQYLLELLTCKKKNDQTRRMYDDGVIIRGNLNDIPLLSSQDGMSLTETFEHNRGYKIEWRNHRATFSISFPPEYELISGINKIELENRFGKLVCNHKITRNISSHIDGDTVRISEDLLVVKNGFYIIEQMECSKYFTSNKGNYIIPSQIDSIPTVNTSPNTVLHQIESIKNTLKSKHIKRLWQKRFRTKHINNNTTDSLTTNLQKYSICLTDTLHRVCPRDSLSSSNRFDTLSLVSDVTHPIESLRNLLSISSIQNNYTIEVKLNKYGFKQEIFNCPLSQLIDFCLQEGCKPYVGIEKVEENTITAVLIMVQPYYGYNHIFKVEFNPETLRDKSGIIHCIVNVYIPTHNVSNLYGEKNNNI